MDSLLLPFQRQLLAQLVPTQENDSAPESSLTILARGVGLRSLVTSFLRVYNSSANLVLILNATEDEERGLKEQVGSGFKIISHEVDIKGRAQVYKSGGIMSVTSRIIVVDLLSGVIPVTLVTGIVILHAEDAQLESNEAFAISILRQFNRTAFIQAFSDEPEYFTYGMSPLQSSLSALKIRKVHIWPRFRQEILQDLTDRRVDVQELYQPLTPAMRDIQTSIIECMDLTLSEIKRSHTSLDVEDLNVENALFKSFDHLVRAQLDTVWHKVGYATRQLLGDLGTLRRLQVSLLDNDCIDFLGFLETIFSLRHSYDPSRAKQSAWLSTDAGSRMLELARGRAYVRTKVVKSKVLDEDAEAELVMQEMEAASLRPAQSAEERAAAEAKTHRARGLPVGVEPVLEEQPKSSLLADILAEVETELHQASMQDDVANNTILVMCNSTTSCRELSKYLSGGSKYSSHDDILAEKLRKFFPWKQAMHNTIKPSSRGDQYKKSAQAKPGSAKAPLMEKVAVVIVESAALKNKREFKGKAPSEKRRRVRGGANAAVDQETLPDKNAGEIAEQWINEVDAEIKSVPKATGEIDEKAFEEYFGLLENESLVIVRPLTGDDDDRMLEELRPKYIIMYDPSPAFVRRIEVFRAAHQNLAVRVYFLMYKDSVEEQRYLSTIRREKNAFEKLIRERKTMVIPLEVEYREGEEAEHVRTVSSRIGGGGKQVEKCKPRVVVDVREFRSALPCLLFKAGFDVVPITITIGDYIITPEMCVERKSLPDLIESLNSGHLFEQCEAMTAHYKEPILLIEFDEKKAFSIDAYDNRSKAAEANAEPDLRHKLVLLTISFPRLKIIWSSSPHATVDIFRDLKQNRAEPDQAKAVLVGGDESQGGVTGEGTAQAGFNPVPQEMLLTLPGITAKNCRHVMSKLSNMRELTEASLTEIQELIGVDLGITLYNFFNLPIGPE